MATYKEIHGVEVQYRASDATAIEGDVWYNSTFGKLKMYAAAGAWAAGGNVNTHHDRGAGGGTQTAAIVFAGGSAGVTETYDGSSWTEVADLKTGRSQLAAAGQAPQTTALGFGGSPPSAGVAIAELWNGTSWTEVADLNTARKNLAGFGISTAAVAAAGQVPGGTINKAEVEEYNGTSWTEVTDIPTAVREPQGSGILTSGVVFGGYVTAVVATTAEYDGTDWASGGNLNTARTALGGTGATSTATLAYAGEGTADLAVTEEYNGSAWTEVADMSTARNSVDDAGTQNLALAVSGTPNYVGTEEWSAVADIQTVAFD